MSQKLTIQDAINEAQKRNGKCLSESYINSDTPMDFQCKNEQHPPFLATLHGVRSGHWCPPCGHGDLTIQDAIDEAEKHNGKCLSTSYVNNRTPIDFQCENKQHPPFHATLHNVKSGRWCKRCDVDRRRATIQDAIDEAKKHNGKCLSESYVDNKTLMDFQCENKQHPPFPMTLNDVKSRHWCPACYLQGQNYTGQKTTHGILETLFAISLPTERPEWLINPLTHRILELDGFNADANIAYEYDGIQHTEYHKFFHRTEKEFLNQRKRDEEKTRICKKQGVLLLRISAPKKRTTETILTRVLQSITAKPKAYRQLAYNIYPLLTRAERRRLSSTSRNILRNLPPITRGDLLKRVEEHLIQH